MINLIVLTFNNWKRLQNHFNIAKVGYALEANTRAVYMLTNIFIHVERLDIFERQFALFTVLNQQLVRANRRAACQTFKYSEDSIHDNFQQECW